MAYRVTNLFNLGKQGYSITFFHSLVGDINQGLLNDGASLGRALQDAMVPAVSWEATRFQSIEAPRRTRLVRVVGGQANLTSTSARDVTNTAWLVDVRSIDGLVRRQFWLRGVPDAQTEFDVGLNIWLPNPKLTRNFDTIKTLLTAPNSPWRIPHVRPVDGLDTSTKLVSSAATTGLNKVSLVLVGANPFDPFNDDIIVAGFKKPNSYINGVYRKRTWALGVGSVVELPRTALAGLAFVPTSTVTVRRRIYDYVQIGLFQTVEPRSRRTGRAFFVPLGRRSAVQR